MFSIHLPYRFPETDEYTFTLNHFLYYYFIFKYISFTPQQVNTLQKWTYDFLFLKRTLGLRIISGLYACYEKYSKITEPILNGFFLFFNFKIFPFVIYMFLKSALKISFVIQSSRTKGKQ